jgi:hypothetical protein
MGIAVGIRVNTLWKDNFNMVPVWMVEALTRVAAAYILMYKLFSDIYLAYKVTNSIYLHV